jgi:hypothetical protein
MWAQEPTDGKGNQLPRSTKWISDITHQIFVHGPASFVWKGNLNVFVVSEDVLVVTLSVWKMTLIVKRSRRIFR